MWQRTSCGVGIARAKFPMPVIPGDPIETEKWMIRRAALFRGIVTDLKERDMIKEDIWKSLRMFE